MIFTDCIMFFPFSLYTVSKIIRVWISEKIFNSLEELKWQKQKRYNNMNIALPEQTNPDLREIYIYK